MMVKSIKDNLHYIVGCLENGKIIVLPTDTLFALSCNADNYQSVEKIFEYKNRFKEKSLPVFFCDIEQIQRVCELNNLALMLAEKFWPGALTLVLPIKRQQTLVAENVYNRGESLAVRIPDSPYLRNIIKELNKPIVATSANISGHNPIQDSTEALKVFGSEVIVVKGKSTNLPSTIIKVNNKNFEIIREGQVKRQELEAFQI